MIGGGSGGGGCRLPDKDDSFAKISIGKTRIFYYPIPKYSTSVLLWGISENLKAFEC